MAKSARLIFIFKKESKTAFIPKGAEPEKLLMSILDFIQNRSKQEQIDYFDSLLLVDPEDKPPADQFPKKKSWKAALNKREVFSLPILFHSETYRESDYIYIINLDKDRLVIKAGWEIEDDFAFGDPRDQILSRVKELNKERLWQKLQNEYEPKVYGNEIYFEEPYESEFRKNFSYINRKFKEAGFSFEKQGRYWFKKSQDIYEDLTALGYKYLADNLKFWEDT